MVLAADAHVADLYSYGRGQDWGDSLEQGPEAAGVPPTCEQVFRVFFVKNLWPSPLKR